MAYYAGVSRDYKNWNYILGNNNMSVALSRFNQLTELNDISQNTLKIALKDPVSSKYTTWRSFWGFKHEQLLSAFDIHRSILYNEIIIESDYVCDNCKINKTSCDDCYYLNYKATKVIGSILENKGIIPHYYYSGSKSIHIHLYFDFKKLLGLPMELQEEILNKYTSKGRFLYSFMNWFRKLVISGWDTECYGFDKALIKSSHLIRSEMSRNKRGYKTFLGYSHRDLSFIPYICNESNSIYPQIGEIKFSVPNNLVELLTEFLFARKVSLKLHSARNKELSLKQWLIPPQEKQALRSCVQCLLNDSFKDVGDGFKRAMFILINELKETMDNDKVLETIRDWNLRMGTPISDPELRYRVNSTTKYTLSTKYIHEFMDSVGFNPKM